MPEKKGSSAAKTRSTEFIDLNLRIKNDGGPMFAFLSSIEDPYARGDRVRQLIYLGMLAERGMVGAVFSQQPASIPMAPLVESVSKAAPKSSAKEVPSESTEVPLKFEADDLSAIFGTVTPDPNLGA